ncbi:hypothetical protein [Deinococcus deserti]|uniref:HTH marR-type domain-containing protein n=1 Tax=Deinococcus deserti (strain DSM 17065 / CIP 109153 / LMG 22923 / VCD115) TaxID=546414 RepID=C1D061_DEIDV|nr:hypothetical protein [Deinococcus deserti]ACO47330.2 Hypothetical protein Deide_22951 [Deinococcus deserti VCD115]
MDDARWFVRDHYEYLTGELLPDSGGVTAVYTFLQREGGATRQHLLEELDLHERTIDRSLQVLVARGVIEARD